MMVTTERSTQMAQEPLVLLVALPGREIVSRASGPPSVA
jgi:hypothetical protein